MTTEEIVRRAVEAYDNGDAEAVARYLHTDIRYCIHADAEIGPYCADCRGPEAFWQAVGKIQADWVIDSYRLKDLIVAGDRAATQIDLETTSRHTGVSRKTELALFWTIKDEQVIELHEYHDTAAAAQARG